MEQNYIYVIKVNTKCDESYFWEDWFLQLIYLKVIADRIDKGKVLKNFTMLFLLQNYSFIERELLTYVLRYFWLWRQPWINLEYWKPRYPWQRKGLTNLNVWHWVVYLVGREFLKILCNTIILLPINHVLYRGLIVIMTFERVLGLAML